MNLTVILRHRIDAQNKALVSCRTSVLQPIGKCRINYYPGVLQIDDQQKHGKSKAMYISVKVLDRAFSLIWPSSLDKHPLVQGTWGYVSSQRPSWSILIKSFLPDFDPRSGGRFISEPTSNFFRSRWQSQSRLILVGSSLLENAVVDTSPDDGPRRASRYQPREKYSRYQNSEKARCLGPEQIFDE